MLSTPLSRTSSEESGTININASNEKVVHEYTGNYEDAAVANVAFAQSYLLFMISNPL